MLRFGVYESRKTVVVVINQQETDHKRAKAAVEECHGCEKEGIYGRQNDFKLHSTTLGSRERLMKNKGKKERTTTAFYKDPKI